MVSIQPTPTPVDIPQPFVPDLPAPLTIPDRADVLTGEDRDLIEEILACYQQRNLYGFQSTAELVRLADGKVGTCALGALATARGWKTSGPSWLSWTPLGDNLAYDFQYGIAEAFDERNGPMSPARFREEIDGVSPTIVAALVAHERGLLVGEAVRERLRERGRMIERK